MYNEFKLGPIHDSFRRNVRHEWQANTGMLRELILFREMFYSMSCFINVVWG